MKKILIFIVLCLPVLANAQDSTQRILREGTVVSVRLTEALSSSSAQAGDLVLFETTEPILTNGNVLIDKQTRVTGRITEAAPRRGMGKAGKLTFSIDYLNLPGGKNIKLIGEQKVEGETKVGTAVAEAVLLTPLFLLKKGKDINYAAGSIFKAYVEKDTAL